MSKIEFLEGVVLYDRQKILVKHQNNKPFQIIEVRPRTLVEKKKKKVKKPSSNEEERGDRAGFPDEEEKEEEEEGEGEGGEGEGAEAQSKGRWNGSSTRLTPGDQVTVKLVIQTPATSTSSTSSTSTSSLSLSSISTSSSASRNSSSSSIEPGPSVTLSVTVEETGGLLPELSDEDILRIQAFKYPQWLGPPAAIERQYCGLPVELMLQVFSHLKSRDFHSCMLTCKSWHLLVRDQSLDALWFAQIRDELLRRMMVRARKEIQIHFRAMERYQEMRQLLSKNISHLFKKITSTLKAEGIEKGNLLTFTLLFQRPPERDGPRDYLQPFASISRVFDFITMISINALDLNALLSRFGQESAVLGRTSIPLQNPIRGWLTQRETKRNLLRAVCRHFAGRTRAINAVLMVKPHLFPRFVSRFGVEGLGPDEGYWLFEFADYAADCPAHLREWINKEKNSKLHRTLS